MLYARGSSTRRCTLSVEIGVVCHPSSALRWATVPKVLYLRPQRLNGALAGSSQRSAAVRGKRRLQPHRVLCITLGRSPLVAGVLGCALLVAGEGVGGSESNYTRAGPGAPHEHDVHRVEEFLAEDERVIQ